MDTCKKRDESMEEVARQPLVPSEKNNSSPNVRKIRPREVISRYKAGNAATNTKRHPSPSAPRTKPVSPSILPNRSQSAERKRPSVPQTRSSAPSSPSSKPSSRPSSPMRPSTPVRDTTIASLQLSSHRTSSSRTPDGLWPSMRSLSSSFQSESISIPIARRDSKHVASLNSSSKDHTLNCSVSGTPERKRTPLRGRSTSDYTENLKTVTDTSHSKVVDQHRWPGMIGRKTSGSVTSRSTDLTVVTLRGVSPRRRTVDSDGPVGILKKSTSDGTRRMSFDGIGREELETSTHHNVSSNVRERSSSLTRASRTTPLPASSPQHPSSPDKATSPTAPSSRSLASPSRSRPSSPYSPSNSTSGRVTISSSVLSYISDARKVKRNANNVEDVHQLRISYSRYLQWRFVNALADDASLIQKRCMEEDLYSTCENLKALRNSVASKKIKVQHLKQELKLNSILEEQMLHLEDWALLESDHSCSLEAAVEALRASTLRLPVIGGAKADTKSLKDAINAAIDIMGSMGSSICSLLSKVEGRNSAISELANLAAEEKFMLEHCRELLSSTAAMQVQESSLRTHLLQLNQHTTSEISTQFG